MSVHRAWIARAAPSYRAAMHLSSKLLTLPLVLSLALAACGGAQKKSSAAAAAACGAAGANTAHLLAAAAPQAPATMTADIGGAIERHCRADAWTPEAQACIAKAADDNAMDVCDPLLTQAQKDAVGAEIGEIVGKAMGGAGYGGAGYGGAGYGGAINP